MNWGKHYAIFDRIDFARGILGALQVIFVTGLAFFVQQRSEAIVEPFFDAICSALPAASASELQYLVANDAAMKRMMSGMAIKPTGDVDHDFVSMMSSHHQGAIDMARAVLRYGRNEQIKRLAQEIIVTQLQEITAMRLAVGDPLPLPGIPQARIANSIGQP